MATRTELSTAADRAGFVLDDYQRPDNYDIELATRAVRVHCVTQQPDGEVCLNCRWPHPCVTHRWGRRMLEAAGWSDADIAAIDTRTGPWS